MPSVNLYYRSRPPIHSKHFTLAASQPTISSNNTPLQLFPRGQCNGKRRHPSKPEGATNSRKEGGGRGQRATRKKSCRIIPQLNFMLDGHVCLASQVDRQPREESSYSTFHVSYLYRVCTKLLGPAAGAGSLCPTCHLPVNAGWLVRKARSELPGQGATSPHHQFPSVGMRLAHRRHCCSAPRVEKQEASWHSAESKEATAALSMQLLPESDHDKLGQRHYSHQRIGLSTKACLPPRLTVIAAEPQLSMRVKMMHRTNDFVSPSLFTSSHIRHTHQGQSFRYVSTPHSHCCI